MSAREERIADNEALFRDVNERLARVAEREGGTLEIVCECGDRDCIERITVSVDEYEQARSDPTHFLAKRGHIEAGIEQLVSTSGDHQLIRKTGDAAAVAEERDPRS